MISATSFMVGDETRKDMVTPKGTPDCSMPMKSGIAEHVQNGVNIPKQAASILPVNSCLWLNIALILSGGKKVRIIATTKTITASKKYILGTSYRKKFKLEATFVPLVSFKMS
jgi:hypothetical protein